jgi:bacillithiol biosynthesis cysteine-adding enzyme BshC
MQKIIRLKLDELRQYFSRIDADYAEGAEALRDFYATPVDWENLEGSLAVRAAAFSSEKRQILADTLAVQYANIKDDAHKARILAQIEKLRLPNTLVVTTAHQPLLATGVLYYIYKVLAACRLAEELQKRQPTYNIVPVYWSGGEDHDFEEISTINIFSKSLAWARGEKGGSVGRMPTDADLQAFVAVLAPVLGDSENAQQILATIRAAYTDNNTYAEATTQLLHSLFGRFGLVAVNPDAAGLKTLFVPIMRNDLTNHDSARLVSQTVQQLEARGYNNQAFVREINLFYLLPNARERIVWWPEKAAYQVLNTELWFDREALLGELAANPQNFSPNVILRPLYQETILPNVAFIGGGGEIAYWLERRAQFDFFAVPMPMLVRRPSLLLLDSSAQERLTKLNLQPLDLLPHYDAIAKNYLVSQSDLVVSCDGEREKMIKIFEILAAKANELGNDIVSFVAAQQAQADNILSRIEEKFTRAAKKKEETQLLQIQKLKDKLFPNGGLQERSDNFLAFYLQYGDALLGLLAETMADPLSQDFSICYLHS